MLNRWQGNTGKVIRVAEPGDSPLREPVKNAEYNTAQPPKKPPLPPLSPLSSLLSRGVGELESEDILLLLILYLMYRESGDSELLMIMGAMFLS